MAAGVQDGAATAPATAAAPTDGTTPRRLTLYAHADALLDVETAIRERLDEIAANGGALPDDLSAALDAAEGGFDAKLERVGLLARENRAAAAAAKSEAKRLSELAKSYEGTADALDRYALREMTRTGRESVKAPRLALSAVVTGTPASTIDSEAAVVVGDDLEAVRARVVGREEFYQFISEEVLHVPARWELDRQAVLRSWKAAYEVALAAAPEALAALRTPDAPAPTPAECRAYAEQAANADLTPGVTFRRSVTLRTR